MRKIIIIGHCAGRVSNSDRRKLEVAENSNKSRMFEEGNEARHREPHSDGDLDAPIGCF